MRTRRLRLGVTALAVSGVAVLLWSGASGSASAQGLGRQVEIRAPLWMVGDGFTSSLTINNTQPRPVGAELGVYDHDGRRIPTQELNLGPLASVDVDLGAMLGDRTGFGRIALGHDGGLLDVAAQVVIHHRQRGMTFNQGLLPPGHQDGNDLAGVSDLGVSAAGSLLALANTGARKRRVSIELLLDNRRSTGSIELGAGQTRLVSLGDASQNRQPVSETAFGVRVRHDGGRGEVQAQGLLMTAGGLAANLRLADRAALRSRRALSPLLRFDARQRPLLALYNLSPAQVSVIPEIRFRVGESHGLIQATTVRLLPGSVSGVDLTEELRPYPEARDLSLSLRHEGTAGSVAAELLIVDAAGRSAAQATPKDAAGEGTVGMTFAWRLEGNANTVIAVANPSASEGLDFEAVLFFGGRTYTWSGEGFLRPGEARQIDIRRLREQQVPGQAGELLPADVTSGQAKVFVRNTPERVNKLIGQAVQVAADGSLTGFLSCPVCPPDPSSASLSPLSLTGDVGGSKRIYPWMHWTDGSKSLVINPAGVTWDVGNEKVATVSEAWSNFRVQFKGPGETTIGATMSDCNYVLPEQDPSDDAAPSECVCQQAVSVTAAKKATATTRCPIPTGETTSAKGWADDDAAPAVHQFEQTLKPTGTSFTGRTITESDSSTATDTCWWSGSRFRKVTGVTSGEWTVRSRNRWGLDSIGWTDLGTIQYYREQGRAPCGFTKYQRLTISGCGGGSSSTVYRTNVPLSSTFTDTHVTVSRSGVSKTRRLTIE